LWIGVLVPAREGEGSPECSQSFGIVDDATFHARYQHRRCDRPRRGGARFLDPPRRPVLEHPRRIKLIEPIYPNASRIGSSRLHLNAAADGSMKSWGVPSGPVQEAIASTGRKDASTSVSRISNSPINPRSTDSDRPAESFPEVFASGRAVE